MYILICGNVQRLVTNGGITSNGGVAIGDSKMHITPNVSEVFDWQSVGQMAQEKSSGN